MLKRLFFFTVLFTLLKFMTTGLMAMETSPLNVEGGMIKGVSFGQGEVGWAYYGIPYAAPPLGDLRWRLPQAVIPWEGIRDCTDRDKLPVMVWIHGGGSEALRGHNDIQLS
jgi:para-nitrobenzyl esterase